MTRIRTFQTLVVVSSVLLVFWYALPHLPLYYRPEIQTLLSYSGVGAPAWIQHPTFYLSLGAAKLISLLGLFLFLSWGRWLFTACVLVGVAVLPLSGIAVIPPLDSLIGGVLCLLDGAIFALAFLSPIAECWRKDA